MIRRAFAYSILRKYAELVIQFGSVVILARFIPPDEYGIFVAAAAAVMLAEAIGEFGQRDYVITQGDLTRARRRAAVGLSLAVSTLCAAVILLCSLLLPASIMDERLAPVLMVLAAALLVRPLNTAFLASFERAMRFDTTLALGTVQAATMALVSITLAWWGFGAISVAWGTLAGVLAQLALAMALGGRSMAILPDWRGWRAILRFGSMRTAVTGMSQAGDALSMLAISNLLGFGAAGLMQRAQTISGLFGQIVLEAVRPVVLPVLAERARNKQSLKDVYLLKVSYVGVTAWPCFAFIALFAEPIVHLLLGSDWHAAVPIVRVLCLSGLVGVFTNLNPRFFVALEMLPVLLRRQALLQPVRVAMVSGGALVSLEMAALGFFASNALKAVLDLGPLKRRLGDATNELMTALWPSLGVAFASLVPVAVLVALFSTGSTMPGHEDAGMLFAAMPTLALGWVIGVFAFNHPIAGELTRAVRVARLQLRMT